MNTGCIWHHNQPPRLLCHLIWLHQRYPDLYPHLSTRRQQAMSRAAINTRVRFMVCSSNDPAQHRQIHRIKYEQVLISENHLSELMTFQSIEKVFYNRHHLNLDKLSTAKKRKLNPCENFLWFVLFLVTSMTVPWFIYQPNPTTQNLVESAPLHPLPFMSIHSSDMNSRVRINDKLVCWLVWIVIVIKIYTVLCAECRNSKSHRYNEMDEL